MPTDHEAPGAEPTGDGDVLAVLEVNGQRMGVAASSVVQVIVRPATLARLPRAGPTLAGVVSFRGRVVPVVDLALWVSGEPGAATSPPTHIAILTGEGAWIGLLIDAVRGLARIAPTDIQRLHHDDHPDEFFHSVAATGSEGQPLSLLDAGQLMRRARAWSADTGADARDAAHGTPSNTTGGGDSTGRYAVVRVGQRLYGLPAEALAEVLPRPAVQAVLGSGSGLLGTLRWRGRDVPLVDPMPQLGSPDHVDGAPWVAIVTDADRCIAVPCHGMDQVRAFASADVQNAASAQGLCSAACTGLVLQADGDPIRLVDASALVGAFNVAAISRQSATNPSARQAHSAERNREAHVVFQARSRFAAPIHQLQEIMPLPAGFSDPGSADGLAGSLEWRGQAVPLIDLQRRLWPGAAPVTTPKRVLITHLGDQLAAVLVGEVEVLIPPLAGVQTHLRLPNGEPMGMITVEQDGARSSYRLIDLHALPMVG